jgi:hypothetical protein
MARTKPIRIGLVASEHEAAAIDALARYHSRTKSDVIRWLAMCEAERLGLVRPKRRQTAKRVLRPSAQLDEEVKQKAA